MSNTNAQRFKAWSCRFEFVQCDCASYCIHRNFGKLAAQIEDYRDE